MTAWRDRLPTLRGRLAFDEPLAPFTWLRVGGPAEVLFLPADEADLAAFLKALDPAVPVTVLGAASNTLVRDGGVEGVVVRLGKAFAGVGTDGLRVTAGAAALDTQASRAAGKAGIAGLEFYTGVPGSIGGAVVMNAGCYGQETKDVLVEAHALTRAGDRVTLSNAQMGYSYRHSDAVDAQPLIFTAAVFEGTADDPAAVQARMAAITARREQSQPIREKTSGSTFKNPVNAAGEKLSAWKCVDEAGWRGKPFAVTGGGAMFSPQHANFLINPGEATAADLEGLGEAVRADVRKKLGVQLDWEVKRIGRPA
jgi:UDP-N-acetylmuramate dehydrogenase